VERYPETDGEQRPLQQKKKKKESVNSTGEHYRYECHRRKDQKRGGITRKGAFSVKGKKKHKCDARPKKGEISGAVLRDNLRHRGSPGTENVRC